MADRSEDVLAGRTVVVTAERRARDQLEAFAKRGATVRHVPTMHTVELHDDAGLRARTEALIAEPPDWLVATTGFGMRLWFEAAADWGLDEALDGALGGAAIVARGPKARSALRSRDLPVTWQAPSESMAEVAAWLDARPEVAGARVAVQDFDDDTELGALRTRAEVIDVGVYRWRHPDDVAAVRRLVDDLVSGAVDVITFTSQPAVRFLLELAGDRAEAVVAACNDGTVDPVCIGPICAEVGIDAGITTMVWPEPNRLAPMIRLATQVGSARSVPQRPV